MAGVSRCLLLLQEMRPFVPQCLEFQVQRRRRNVDGSQSIRIIIRSTVKVCKTGSELRNKMVSLVVVYRAREMRR